jgi:hypothetical protein
MQSRRATGSARTTGFTDSFYQMVREIWNRMIQLFEDQLSPGDRQALISDNTSGAAVAINAYHDGNVGNGGIY